MRRSALRRLTRGLTATVAATALAAGVLTATATGARAAYPDPPLAVDGWGINHGYQMVWNPPADQVGLGGYTVWLNPASAPEQSPPLQEKALPATARGTVFTGLTPGVEYIGAVSASYGGGGSEPQYGAYDQAYAPIGKVGSLTATAGRNALTVRWRAPVATLQTGKVQSYRVAFSGGAPTLLAASARSVRFGDLTNGRKYGITVTPIAGDTGTAASTSATPIGPPHKPTKFKRTWKKHGKAKLTWKGARVTAAAPVSGYVVYVNGKKVRTLGKSARSYTVKHLKKGKKYSFAVRAKNPVGHSTAATIATKKRP